MFDHPIFSDTKKIAAALVFISLGTLGFVLFTQYGLGLRPCVLCVYQRIPFVVVIAFGILAYALSGRTARGFILLAALALLTGAGIAGFHIGVEQHWWKGTDHCGGALPANASLDELRAAILSAPVTRCDQVTAQFMGISMATYNFIFSGALAAITFHAWRKSR